MADDNSGPEQVTNEAARGAVVGNVVAGIFARGLSNGKTQGAAPIISDAEAKTWKEWADKAPAMLRAHIDHVFHPMKISYVPSAISTVVGVGLGLAAFTKTISRPYRWIAGVGTLAAGFSAASNMYMNKLKKIANIDGERAEKHIGQFIDRYENDAQLKAEFADYLNRNINAAAAQNMGQAATAALLGFGFEKGFLTNERDYVMFELAFADIIPYVPQNKERVR